VLKEVFNVFICALQFREAARVSLVRDAAQARKKEMKGYLRISAFNVATPPPMTSDKYRERRSFA
jgi:hypothetical protein